MTRPARFVFAAAVAAWALSAPAGAEEASLETRLAEKAPSIVTVRVVMKSDDDESTNEIRGTVVDPSGTVMVSSTLLSTGDRSPARLHVMIGTDPKEHPAVLVARDSALRLSFVQMLEPPALSAVDLRLAGAPKLGQDLVGVTRSERAFDFAPKIQRLYVTGRLEKPRPLWDFAGDFGETGLPVFDLAGAPVGVIVDQPAPSGVESEGQEIEYFILPADAALKSLDLARKRIPDAVAKAKKAGDAAKEPEQPPAPAPDAPKAPETPKQDPPR